MFIVGLSYNVPQMPSSYCCWGLSTALINCLYSEGTGMSRQLLFRMKGHKQESFQFWNCLDTFISCHGAGLMILISHISCIFKFSWDWRPAVRSNLIFNFLNVIKILFSVWTSCPSDGRKSQTCIRQLYFSSWGATLPSTSSMIGIIFSFTAVWWW